MFGTVEAKKEGLTDTYKYYTRTFHLPIKMRHPYPNHDCLKCHAGSAKWLATHEDYKDALFSGEATCMQCHGDANPAHNIAQAVTQCLKPPPSSRQSSIPPHTDRSSSLLSRCA